MGTQGPLANIVPPLECPRTLCAHFHGLATPLGPSGNFSSLCGNPAPHGTLSARCLHTSVCLCLPAQTAWWTGGLWQTLVLVNSGGFRWTGGLWWILVDSGGLEYFGWLVESGGLLVNWWTLLEAGGPWWALVDSGGLSWTGEPGGQSWTLVDYGGLLWALVAGGLWWTGGL